MSGLSVADFSKAKINGCMYKGEFGFWFPFENMVSLVFLRNK